MRQIYNFEQKEPPRLREKQLRRELERRTLQRQTLCLALGSLLILCCIVLSAICFSGIMPLFSFLCAGYLCLAGAGGGILVLAFVRRREEEIPC